jgi:hypothetical protein
MSEPAEPTVADNAGEQGQQIAKILGYLDTLKRKIRHVEVKVAELTAAAVAAAEENDPSKPAAWVWFTAPAAAEDDPDGDEDPRFTLTNWVAWYNITFVGVDGGRARPIPLCWQRHPAVAMEVAALAYTWRAANIGPGANERDNQQWLQQWRPGFADRLARDYVLPDCLDGDHRDSGPAARADRFELAEQLAEEAPPEAQNAHPDVRWSS